MVQNVKILECYKNMESFRMQKLWNVPECRNELLKTSCMVRNIKKIWNVAECKNYEFGLNEKILK